MIISNNTSADSSWKWSYFEQNENRTTVILKWTDFSWGKFIINNKRAEYLFGSSIDNIEDPSKIYKIRNRNQFVQNMYIFRLIEIRIKYI